MYYTKHISLLAVSGMLRYVDMKIKLYRPLQRPLPLSSLLLADVSYTNPMKVRLANREVEILCEFVSMLGYCAMDLHIIFKHVQSQDEFECDLALFE